MLFECDPIKNASNKAKHGLSLEDAKALWNAWGIEIALGADRGEFRYARFAMMRGAVHVVVYTYRGAVVRLISARKATDKEATIYESKKPKQ